MSNKIYENSLSLHVINISLILKNIKMKGKRIGQWALLAVICLSFSIGETFAQKKDFANLARYAKENVALPTPAKKRKGLCLWETLLPRGGCGLIRSF